MNVEDLGLPEELNKKSRVLFVRVYDWEQEVFFKTALDKDNALRQVFEEVLEEDPGLEFFKATLTVIIKKCGLKGWIKKDLAALYGAQGQIDKAQHIVERDTKYTCFQDTIKNSMGFASKDGSTVTIKGPMVS